MSLTIRQATKADLEFLLSLIPRFSEFGLPPARDVTALNKHTQNALQTAFDGDSSLPIFIAEEDGQRLGFIQMREDKEFLSGEPHAYVLNLTVAKEAEGKGAGTALIQAAETWAKEKGYRFMSLNVFGTNYHARAFYKKLNFEEDSIKLTKKL